jgi:dTDP-4-amino-4,6-dideoxygalactose transaminase
VVPFFDLTRQYRLIEDEVLAVTRRVYEGGRFILGEEVSAFEEEFAAYCGVRYAVAVGSGTDALRLAMKAAGIEEGDEVVTVAHSFIASALAISFTGAKPLLVDVDPETYTMDPESLEHLLKRRTRQKNRVKAVLPIHLYGHPAEMHDLVEIANRNDLILIEDACQAHGSEYGGKKTGSFGALGCFSFYPTKNLGAYGDGGAVVTDDRGLADRVRLLRCYGEKQKYHHLLKGTNSRLDEIQAAILRVKLRYLDQWNEVRRKKACAYGTLFSSLPVVRPVEKEHIRHVYHLYVIRTPKRDRLQAFLKERGIDTLIHYPIPIHLQKAYRELGYRRGDLPWTERCSREILSLPFFPEMTEAEMEEVADGIHSFFSLPAGDVRRHH